MSESPRRRCHVTGHQTDSSLLFLRRFDVAVCQPSRTQAHSRQVCVRLCYDLWQLCRLSVVVS